MQLTKAGWSFERTKETFWREVKLFLIVPLAAAFQCLGLLFCLHSTIGALSPKALASDNDETVPQDDNFAPPFLRSLLTFANQETRHEPFAW